MKEDKFIRELQKRATEQQIVLHGVPFPGLFLFVSKKLGEYPWRLIIPFSVGLSIVFHYFIGKGFDEKILWLFGAL